MVEEVGLAFKLSSLCFKKTLLPDGMNLCCATIQKPFLPRIIEIRCFVLLRVLFFKQLLKTADIFLSVLQSVYCIIFENSVRKAPRLLFIFVHISMGHTQLMKQ